MTNGLAAEAHSVGSGTGISTAIVIGILDTGIDLSHPDLVDELVAGATFVEGTATPQDDNGHGTEIAGVVQAMTAPDAMVPGTKLDARLMPVKVADSRGHTNDREVARGIRWTVDQGVRILNVSLGTHDIEPMRSAIEYAFARDVVVVAASPAGISRFPSPAMYDRVLSVGAATQTSASLVNGRRIAPHLVLAPAAGVVTTRLGGGRGEVGATVSIATPHVTALVALLRSVRPDLTATQVIHAVESGADLFPGQTGPDSARGWGRINARHSLSIALDLLPANGNACLERTSHGDTEGIESEPLSEM